MDMLQGYFSIVYSPDDELETGKGYYAELCWNHKTSPLYDNPHSAMVWAGKHGGHTQLKNGDGRTY